MADEPDYEHGQPPPIPNDRPGMHDLVITDLTARREYGLEKYKTLLQVGNGRDPGTDAYEEVLDLIVYLRQWREEWNELRARLDRVARQHTCEDCTRCPECGVTQPCPTFLWASGRARIDDSRWIQKGMYDR